MKTLILTQSDVNQLLDLGEAISAVEGAFLAHGRGETRMPSKVYLQLPDNMGDFRAMPAYISGSAGVKWVNSHPENPRRHGLPTVMGLYILSDPLTALPLAILDATLLTAVRTGAAAAVASRHLASKRPPKRLGLVGCGVQARFILDAHRQLFSDLEVVAADISRQAAERFSDENDTTVGSIEEAAACDIVCTATPSRRPVLRRQWLSEEAHVNAMGADAPGKQELELQVLLDADVFVDDREQAFESGEVNVPLHQGELSPSGVRGTLGELLAGHASRSSRSLTVFDSTGLAIQDLALARNIYEKARHQGMGREVEFIQG